MRSHFKIHLFLSTGCGVSILSHNCSGHVFVVNLSLQADLLHNEENQIWASNDVLASPELSSLPLVFQHTARSSGSRLQQGCSWTPRIAPDKGKSSIRPLLRSSRQHQEAQQSLYPQDFITSHPDPHKKGSKREMLKHAVH